MHFAIRHTTCFTYDRPVFLEPHLLRLRPRCDGIQHLSHFDLEVVPQPAGISQCLDLDGNAVVRLWFEGEHPALTFTTTSQVETAARNPFDFFLDPAALQLPLRCPDRLAALLAPYRIAGEPEGEVAALARRLAREAGGGTLPFLGALNTYLHRTCDQVFRPDGDPLPPERTLSLGQGACRDLAVLFMEACRCMGIPARFVSGYQADAPEEERQDLHAWAEVYLPGAGWRGYDPTRGLSVVDRHVALAAGPTHEQARPTEGTFRGTGVAAGLRAQISIQTTAAAPPHQAVPTAKERAQ
ncbi:MAG: transglutaminase family protein [Candidatus Latescibacteria bacterium]|nr:transglutaminase family protein [Candidatus Latescibacterota bacterium]